MFQGAGLYVASKPEQIVVLDYCGLFLIDWPIMKNGMVLESSWSGP